MFVSSFLLRSSTPLLGRRITTNKLNNRSNNDRHLSSSFPFNNKYDSVRSSSTTTTTTTMRLSSSKNDSNGNDNSNSNSNSNNNDDDEVDTNIMMSSGGHDGTLSEQTFSELYENQLPSWMLERLKECGWTHPTIVQRRAMDVILERKNDNNNNNNNNSKDEDDVERGNDTMTNENSYMNDVIIQSHTGSGKTLAYLLPLLARIDPTRSAVQGVVIVPTRELGVQVSRIARRICAASNGIDSSSSSSSSSSSTENDNEGYDNEYSDDESERENASMSSSSSSGNKRRKKITIMSLLQGGKNKRQRAWAWSDPPHVVVGTPAEVHAMVKTGGFKYKSVRFVVVDEVDACLLNNNGGGYHTASTNPNNGGDNGGGGGKINNKKGSYKSKAGALPSSSPSASSFTNSWNLSGAGDLHELLSKYLSPTYDEVDIFDPEFLVADDPRRRSDATSQMKIQSNYEDEQHVISYGTDRQTIFCSATVPQRKHFVDKCVQNKWTIRRPVSVIVSPYEIVPTNLRHVYAACDVGGASSGSDDKNDLDDNIKIEALRRMIKREVQSKRLQGGCRALIFCDAKRDMESMAIMLENDLNGLKTSMSIEETPKRLKVVVSVLRYDDPVMDRSAAMDAFLGGDGRRKYQNFNYGSSSSSSSSRSDSEDEDNNEDASEDRNVNDDNDDDDDDNDDDDEDIVLRIMLATDLAARGLDVADITHIFNYDLPRDGDCYVHRAGRAGRLGKKRRKRNVDDGEGNGNVNDNKSIIKKGKTL